MKRESLQKKRRPTGGGLFVFHSKTRPRRRKKQRVAAGASSVDLGSEVPNLGVARALFVILVLHVAAIAAIFIHNRVTDEDAAVPATDVEPAAAAVGSTAREKLPVIQKGEDFYFVATGDTYERIAGVKGVDVNALRDINDNVKLRAGRILRIPPAGVTVPPGPAPAVAEDSTPVPAVDPTPPPVPAPPVRVTPASHPTGLSRISNGENNPAIRVQRDTPAQPIRVVVDQEATRVSPNIPVAIPVAEPTSGNTYTIKRGDTAWGISRRHKVSVKRLLEANGIADARKLRPGMKLSIPAN